MTKKQVTVVDFEAYGKQFKKYCFTTDLNEIQEAISLITPTAHLVGVYTDIVSSSIYKGNLLSDVVEWNSLITNTYTEE